MILSLDLEEMLFINRGLVQKDPEFRLKVDLRILNLTSQIIFCE